MPSIKRQIANVIERLSGNLVIAPAEVQALPERRHLARLFAYLGVDCVFDVGANGGQYAQMLRQGVRFRGPIISYEPIPAIAAQLDQLRHASGDSAWHVEQLALDAEAGPATFYIAASDQFSSLHRPASDQPARFASDNKIAQEVTVLRSTVAAELAIWQARLGFRRPFLKMDTQGNDMAVIEGAGVTLDSFVGIQTEMAVQRLYEGSATLAESLATLRGKGFEPSAFVPNNDGHFPEMFEVDCILYNVAVNQRCRDATH